MKENKTQINKKSVDTFISSIDNELRRSDSIKLIEMMQQVTGEVPYMWGTSIIGFGTYHYKYESGREGDTATVGFAPRKNALVIYGVIFYDQNTQLLSQLGEYTKGKGCLYVKDLSKVDLNILSKMIAQAYKTKNNK